MTAGAHERDAEITLVAQALLAGEVVALPTETFYALSARALDAEAVARVVRLKGRASGQALPVLCASVAQAETLCAGGALPARARRLAARFWPGALTLVVPARAGLPEPIAPLGEVGIRVSAHPLARALCGAAGPLVGTSANRAGEPPAATASAVRAAFGDTIAHVVDDDAGVRGGLPSTVVRVDDESEEVEFLRLGALTEADVAAAAGAADAE